MNPSIAPVLTLITIALVGVAPAAQAQVERSALPQEIIDCAGESDVMLRLSCYDRKVAEFRNKLVSTPAAIAAAPVRAKNSIDNFGFDAPMDEMTSNVSRIRERPYGELIIYLENGQIWEQKHRDSRFRLKSGESVTISKSAVAGYRLSGNSNNSIQVERLK